MGGTSSGIDGLISGVMAQLVVLVAVQAGAAAPTSAKFGYNWANGSRLSIQISRFKVEKTVFLANSRCFTIL
ncbi:hypothetical protein JFV28_13385 [Pseudomonas sp. TH05]|uniref:hypothetical protein n=1 Tax=unclassified Pseudomonas TaxID=196821 RepID=UPI001914592D|nr:MULTISPECIES: hypothetical protein [unclassified Pseudomonas]MBK5538166.1 hypothetical protein [Pseudomonas sp. TH07]MBK5556853.1 hypothetical protein [Pseudomonas sp. TH05]